jgi:hypothetical protein
MAEAERDHPKDRKPWDRLPGEGEKPYKAFLRYRDLGEKRSVRRAVNAKDLPKKGQNPYWHWWYEWSQKWKWRDRVQAWDDWRDALAQKEADQPAAELAIEEAEERIATRRLQTEQGRRAGKLAKRLGDQIQRVLEAGPIEELGISRYKAVMIRQTVDEEGRPVLQRTETQRQSIMELAPTMMSFLLDGQRLARIAQDEPTEVVQNIGDAVEGILRAAFEVIRAELPPERWEAATQRILDACRDLDTPKSK